MNYEKYLEKAKKKGKKPKSFERWRERQESKQIKIIEYSKIRTHEEFVEEMILDGRSLNQIMIVTSQTYWKTKKQEIKEYAEQLFKKIKKKRKS